MAGPVKSEPLLIISGGGTPEMNAINHLDNVRWVESLWQGRGPVWSLVADGKDTTPDAARLADVTPDDVEWWLQYLVLRTDGVLHFENSRTPALYDAATTNALQRWIHGPGKKLKSGTTLNIYVTDHGDRLDDQSEIVLWGESINADAFARELDRLPKGVGVRLIMAQCYSGGFTETVGHLLERERSACGFFSTLPDRLASGCRPDPEAVDYHEYTTSFFENLLGKSRLRPDSASGRPAESYRAAHFRASAELQTIDVPTMSSEWFTSAANPLPSDADAIRSAYVNLPTQPPLGPAEVTLVATMAEALNDVTDRLEAELLLRFPEVLYPYAPGAPGRLMSLRPKIERFLRLSPLLEEWLILANRLGQIESAAMASEIASARYQRRQRLAALASSQGFNRRTLPEAAWRRLIECEMKPVSL